VADNDAGFYAATQSELEAGRKLIFCATVASDANACVPARGLVDLNQIAARHRRSTNKADGLFRSVFTVRIYRCSMRIRVDASRQVGGLGESV